MDDTPYTTQHLMAVYVGALARARRGQFSETRLNRALGLLLKGRDAAREKWAQYKTELRDCRCPDRLENRTKWCYHILSRWLDHYAQAEAKRAGAAGYALTAQGFQARNALVEGNR